jgi:hypothetical protein
VRALPESGPRVESRAQFAGTRTDDREVDAVLPQQPQHPGARDCLGTVGRAELVEDYGRRASSRYRGRRRPLGDHLREGVLGWLEPLAGRGGCSGVRLQLSTAREN